MKPKAVFVTGTDTGVGKTVVTGLLARFLKEKDRSVITQKWIQTGCVGFSSDVEMHLKIMSCDKDSLFSKLVSLRPRAKRRGSNLIAERLLCRCAPRNDTLLISQKHSLDDNGRHNSGMSDKNSIKDYLPYVSPYIFKTPCSPHLASKTENKTVSAEKIKKSFKVLCREFDFVIVEGVGGALVPFNEKRLVIDIAKELDLPVVVVAANKLGAINHTLLTIEALKNRKMKMLGVIFNNAKGEDKELLADNPRIIQALSREKILGVLPWIEDSSKLYEKIIPIGQRILNAIKNM